MTKKKENLKRNVVQIETTENENVETVPMEEVTASYEPITDMEVEVEKSAEDVTANNKEPIEKKEIKKLVANTSFNDKYIGTKYEANTEFIITSVKETRKIEDKKYEISESRAKELKSSGYVD